MFSKTIYLAIIISVVTACEKKNYCPDVVRGIPESEELTTQELGSIGSLFVYNNLNKSNLHFFYLFIDEFGHRHAGCNQYVNNLKVLSDKLYYHFNRIGKFYWLSGTYVDVIDLPTTPELEVAELKGTFKKLIENDTHYAASSESIVNNCLICELGYYNLNTGIDKNPSWCLAWSIHPDNSEYPKAYINDSSGFVIKYENGINSQQ